MLLFLVMCQSLVDEPADALRFENRSEIAIMAERLAALESQAVQREARIGALERRLREIEHQLPIHRREVTTPLVHSSGEWLRWDVQWLQSEIRWETNGELARQEPEPQPLGSTVPQPHRVRGTRMSWHFGGPRRRSSYLEIGSGPDIAEYWIAPPTDYWSNPLDHGLVIGTEAYRVAPEAPSIFDAFQQLLQYAPKPYGHEMAW